MPDRYIRHTHEPPPSLDAAKIDISAALASNLQLLQRHTPDGHTQWDPHVYRGIAGTVLVNYRLSAQLGLFTEQSISTSDDLLSRAHIHLHTALSRNTLHTRRDAAHSSFLETSVGLATLVLTTSLGLQPPDDTPSVVQFSSYWKGCIEILNNAISLAVHEDPDSESDDGCEVLYGRAGLLYALLSIRSSLHSLSASLYPDLHALVMAVEPLVSDSAINDLTTSIIYRGKIGSAFYAAALPHSMPRPALMWSWHGKRYLGAAHGVAGILHILLSCPLHIIEPHKPLIIDTVNWLVDCQEVSGNWPTKAPSSPSANVNHSELLQWCHGAPGTLILLCTLLKRHTTSIPPALCNKFLVSLQRGATLTYKHGLLRKGLGLCHGVSGSIFSLLAVSDVLDRPSSSESESGVVEPDYEQNRYLLLATHLAHLATTHADLVARGQMRVPDRPWSLYEGMAGMCCAWGEVMTRWARANGDGNGWKGMPGYDDLDLE